ncbi:MAG: c-type cytochrome [Kiritimatiellae bacterium]|nr:c-type cytochrome [Kiritimatiellia bacterium]
MICLVSGSLLLFGNGCELRKRMYDQPKYEPLEQSDFFGDARSARALVEGTVPRGHLNEDMHLYEGKINGAFADTVPFPITKEVLKRGQNRYNIYCAVCHDRAGYGNGMIVQRGFKRPSSYHIDRLRKEKPGYLYDVINRGFGSMPSYSHQLNPEDRWAVVAYIRALQLSQSATLEDVPKQEREKLLTEKQ